MNISVTGSQINDMTHAIGLVSNKVKRKKYEAYRNRYIENRDNPLWEDLVTKGYASKHIRANESEIMIVYSVTRAGLDFLESIYAIKITEDEE